MKNNKEFSEIIFFEKITKVWNSSKRFNNNLFTREEIEFAQVSYSSVSEYIWNYFNEEYFCNCGKKTNFISLPKGYKNLCNDCTITEKTKKYQKSMLEKYGYISVFQNKDIHNSAINSAKSKESRIKAQFTMLSNGTHQSSRYHIDKSNETKLKKFGSTGFVNREKQNQTKLERYGNENFSNIEKAQSTMFERYGVTCFAKSKQFKEKYSGINNPMYNHFSNINDFNDDFIKTNFINEFGFDLEKACQYFNCTYNAFKYKDYYCTNNKIGRIVEDNFRIIFQNEFEFNNRTFIKPFEIDMLSHESKFGIEYNGLYWHSSLFKDYNYHLNKTNLVESKDYQLFHIFENEWLDSSKQEIWKSIINNKLGKNTKIYARNCTIKEVHLDVVRNFLNSNHLQGYTNSKINIGLFFKNELMSLMAFSKSRYNKKIDYELIRFCSKLNTVVIGGASKLLKYFEQKFKPTSLISYANRRWSQGNLYEKLNFNFSHYTKPNYFYLNKNNLESRQKYQKHKLEKILAKFDSTLSESENMQNNGFKKIYDSGNRVYIKEYND